MTDYVSPKDLVQEAVQLAGKKAGLCVRDMLIRGILAGAFLGYATSLVFVVLSQGLAPIVGAILFPVGFVILVLLGLELVTGNFALLPAGAMAGTGRFTKLLRNWGWVYLGNLIEIGFVILVLLVLELVTGNFALLPAGAMAGTVRFTKLLRNWGWVYLGNLIGSLLYAALFLVAITNCHTGNGGAVADLLKQAAQKKTLAYMALGPSGWGTALVKAILCNWMVTIGAGLAMPSN